MKRIWRIIRRELKRNLTVMLIPHNTIKPLRISFSLTVLLCLIGFWTAFTLWAGYLSSRHIDYWKIKTDNRLMELKVIFFANQVKKSQEMLEQVKENDAQLRALLEMKSKKAIIETEGRGGPSTGDAKDLERLLAGKIYEMNHQDILRQTAALQEETKKTIESFREITRHIDQQRSLYNATPNIWPCLGHVTSYFGLRFHPIYRSNEFHAGLDIANDKNTPIHATASGYARVCGWEPGYGRVVVLEHGHGYRTIYGHMHKIAVKQGERVKRGQVVGYMGSTGTSTGNHVHYEIQYKGNPINPRHFLKKGQYARG